MRTGRPTALPELDLDVFFHPPCVAVIGASDAGRRPYTALWRKISTWGENAGLVSQRHLDRVRCPCLVLAGARDRMVPVADAIEYARRLRAPLRIVPDCGHLVIGERPDACVEAIAELLR